MTNRLPNKTNVVRINFAVVQQRFQCPNVKIFLPKKKKLHERNRSGFIIIFYSLINIMSDIYTNVYKMYVKLLRRPHIRAEVLRIKR